MSRVLSPPTLTPRPGGTLALESPYSANLVTELKSSVPRARWNGQERVWLIPASYGSHVADMCQRWLGTRPTVPTAIDDDPSAETTWSGTLLYVGRCKQRQDRTWSATGYSQSNPIGWQIILPEQVLRDWFEGPGVKPGSAPSLYAALGVRSDVPEQEIKPAYRRAAKLWHPDINKDPDAATQFRAIQEAWELLSDPNRRREYDAGLAFEQLCQGQEGPLFRRYGFGYRSPLTCGVVQAAGKWEVGSLIVSRIKSWNQITNPAGQVLTSYWIAPETDPVTGRQLDPKARGKFETAWVTL